MMSASLPTIEDETILQQVPFMCNLLGLKKTSPHTLFWQETIYSGGRNEANVPVNYLHIDRKRLTLAKRMQNALTPEEWRPWIGSILLLRSWARPRSFRALAASIIAIVLYYAEVLYLAGQGLLGTSSGATIFVLLFPFIPALVVALIFRMLDWRSSIDARNDVLRADRQVAGIIGFERFLAVLQKIESLGFKDDQRFIPRSFRSRQPSIQERIQHLQYCLTNRNSWERSGTPNI